MKNPWHITLKKFLHGSYLFTVLDSGLLSPVSAIQAVADLMFSKAQAF